MNMTKRHTDPLGRAGVRHACTLYALAVAIVITGSAWPSWARSVRASLDTSSRRTVATDRPSIFAAWPRVMPSGCMSHHVT